MQVKMTLIILQEGRIRLLQQDWVDRSEELSKACDGFLRTMESLQTLSRPILQTNQQVRSRIMVLNEFQLPRIANIARLLYPRLG